MRGEFVNLRWITYKVRHRCLLVQVWRDANPLSLDSVILGDRLWVAHPTNERRVDVALLNRNFGHCTEQIMSGISSSIEPHVQPVS